VVDCVYRVSFDRIGCFCWCFRLLVAFSCAFIVVLCVVFCFFYVVRVGICLSTSFFWFGSVAVFFFSSCAFLCYVFVLCDVVFGAGRFLFVWLLFLFGCFGVLFFSAARGCLWGVFCGLA